MTDGNCTEDGIAEGEYEDDTIIGCELGENDGNEIETDGLNDEGQLVGNFVGNFEITCEGATELMVIDDVGDKVLTAVD